MRFLISEATYLGGVYIPARPQEPKIITLPDASTHVSMSWVPLDKKAAAAQVANAEKAGLIKRAKDKDETEKQYEEAMRFRPYPVGWQGHPLGAAAEETPVVDPKKEEAPLPPSQLKNPLNA